MLSPHCAHLHKFNSSNFNRHWAWDIGTMYWYSGGNHTGGFLSFLPCSQNIGNNMNLTVQGIVVREWKAIFMPVRSYGKCYSKKALLQNLSSDIWNCWFHCGLKWHINFLKTIPNKKRFLSTFTLNFMEAAVSHYNEPRSKSVFFWIQMGISIWIHSCSWFLIFSIVGSFMW